MTLGKQDAMGSILGVKRIKSQATGLEQVLFGIDAKDQLWTRKHSDQLPATTWGSVEIEEWNDIVSYQ